MRQKAFFLFLLCICLTSLLVFLLPGRRNHTLKTIVKETQDKISNLRDNLISAGDQLNVGSGDISLAPDPRYLQQLGLFTTDPTSPEEHLATIVTAVEPGKEHLVPGFIRSVGHFLPDVPIVIFDLGLARYEKEQLNAHCNSSLCNTQELQFGLWPNHVHDLKLKAYRPIAVQLVLKDTGQVIWMDVDYRLITSDLSTWLEKAKESGIQAWPYKHSHTESGERGVLGVEAVMATTSLTHPRMFEYFPNIKKEDYEFQHMASGSCLIVVSSPNLFTQLLIPWLKCILTEDCIDPIGAQSTGCRFDKKPQYRYSGCHMYDTSALNIVLGQMFEFRESSYMGIDPFFRKVDEDPKRLRHLRNHTTTLK